MNRPCYVVGCKSSDWRQVSLRHRVPLDSSKRAEWLQRIGLPVSDRRHDIRICGRHFKAEDYEYSSALVQRFGLGIKKHRLRPDALPSLFLPTRKPEKSSSAVLNN
ncbi:hypothetical protein HPB52_012559 [Rhipicephalus sanguineus]|uniref:THAP-type domain-containing protein n=1 Tax=Rhipicephalus sanguineus TaxID=34632 RepID=A0A9D4TA05_RHISA|nr:hypothetical protein HPB52_012559 [Rhipicephalus sanguineus]